MTQPPAQDGAQRRRSQRVMIRLAVLVHGTGADGKPFHEHTHTLAVNAHGALILFAAPVAMRQNVTLANVATEQGCEARVVYVGPKQDGKTQIGVEFVSPNPKFWGIEFPPADWKPFE